MDSRHVNTPPTRLVGQVKGRKVDDHLPGGCVAFIGPNWSGKSARLELVELAVTGRRRAGAAEDLGADGAPVRAALEWGEDDRCLVYDLGEGHDASEDFGPVPAIVRPATGLAALGRARMREELLERFGQVSTAVLEPAVGLSTEQAAIWRELLAEVGRAIETARTRGRTRGEDVASDPATILAELTSTARSAKLAVGRELKALDATLATRRVELAGAGGVELLPQLEAQLAAAEAWERASAARDAAGRFEADVAAYQRDQAAYEAGADVPRDRLAERLAELDRHIAEARSYRARVEAVSALVAPDSDVCGVCGQAFDGQALRAHLAEGMRGVVELESTHAAQRQALAGQLAAIDQATRQRAAERARLEREYARLASLGQSLARELGEAPAYVGPPSAQLREQIRAVRDLETRRRVLEADESRRHVLARRQEDTKAVEVRAGQVQAELIERVSAAVVERVTACLAVPRRLSFDLDACRFEIVGEDGRPHARTEASGAEYAALTLALGRAWATGEVPPIMVLEYETDLAAFDAANQAIVLSALAEARLRGELLAVYLASPVPLELPSGWSAIPTDGTPAAGTIASPTLIGAGPMARARTEAGLPPATRAMLEASPAPASAPAQLPLGVSSTKAPAATTGRGLSEKQQRVLDVLARDGTVTKNRDGTWHDDIAARTMASLVKAGLVVLEGSPPNVARAAGGA